MANAQTLGKMSPQLLKVGSRDDRRGEALSLAHWGEASSSTPLGDEHRKRFARYEDASRSRASEACQALATASPRYKLLIRDCPRTTSPTSVM